MTDDFPLSRAGEPLRPRPALLGAACTSGPGMVWLAVFLCVSLTTILVMSFATRGEYGQVEWRWTFENFRRLAGFGTFGFEPLYPQVIARSLALAAATTVFCGLAALPLTFCIARLSPRYRPFALVLLVIPFWTNLLIRTYAWQLVFAATGWPARLAATLGLIPPDAALYPGTFAVLVGLTCDFLPFLALPLYASVEKIDWSLAEAASDLGARGWPVFRHALLPQILPGLLAGAILVFIAASGQFVIPDLLGGAKTTLIGNAIQQQFGASRDWPFGAAIACLVLLLAAGGLGWLARCGPKGGPPSIL